MAKRIVIAVLLFCWQPSVAQDIVMINARIIDGLGQTIENGNISVSEGRITAVTTDDVDAGDAFVINANGMTVMPGMINTHWHLFAGSAASSDAELEDYLDVAVSGALENILERGITTIM